jgi:hypothetical protein
MLYLNLGAIINRILIRQDYLLDLTPRSAMLKRISLIRTIKIIISYNS